MRGQANHFHRNASEKITYAMNPYQMEMAQLYQGLNEWFNFQLNLGQRCLVVGSKFTKADLACFSFAKCAESARSDTLLFAKMYIWPEAIQQRQRVQKRVDIPDSFEIKEAMKTKQRRVQYAKMNSSWVMQWMKNSHERE